MSANGYLTDAELVNVQGSVRLGNVTGRAWLNMVSYAFSQGVVIAIVLPAGGYRSWATQLDMRARPSIYNITAGILPGLPSSHGFGLCVDVAGNWRWVVANGARWGFNRPANTLAMGDLNHFLHDGRTAGPTISGAGGVGANITPGTADTPEEEEDPDMSVMALTRTTTGSIYGKTANGRVGIQQPSHVGLILRMNRQQKALLSNDAAWDNILQAEEDIVTMYVEACDNRVIATINAARDETNRQLAVRTVEITAAVNALVAKFPTVDSAKISASIIASLGNIQATVDPTSVAKAVDSILEDNFAQVKSEADARQSEVTGALKQVGTIDVPSVVAAVIAGIQKDGVLSEGDEVAIAVAVKNAITPDLVRLELKNQLK